MSQHTAVLCSLKHHKNQTAARTAIFCDFNALYSFHKKITKYPISATCK